MVYLCDWPDSLEKDYVIQKKKIVEKILKNLDPIGKRISQLYSSTHILLYKHP